MLQRDPSSAVASVLAGWDFPIDRTTLAVLDLFDLTVMANTDSKKGKPKPHGGRPFKANDREVTRHGNAGDRTPDEVKAILRRMARGDTVPV